jgi:glycosyltransferase involved in cell wall biosynthesis
MGVLFYPRGGSAQVVRYLSAALEKEDWHVSLLCGSLGRPGERTHAETFYAGMDLTAVDYNPAFEAFEHGRDPIAEPVPFHPSFEHEPGARVPDRVFAAVSPALGDHLTSFWEGAMAEAWPGDPTVIHLHHVTPLNEAAIRRWPDRPLVTHLHGTDLGMLARIRGLSDEQKNLPDWQYADHWAKRLRAAAHRSDRLIVISPHQREVAHDVLGLDLERIEWIPNGVDIERFGRGSLTTEERLARWRRWLVDDPHGWDESGEPGTIRYTERDIDHFADPATGEPLPVLLFVGRFLAMKRVPLLVRAYARARPRLDVPAPLVVWGGFPKEFEGEHPFTVARDEGAEGIFFVGWRGHDELPEGLACSDVFVAPSLNEPFGQVYLEAMACGLPVIATRSGGPLSFVNVEPGKPNGWLPEPDDVDALADTIVEAVNDVAARRRRAANAYEQIRAEYSWHHLAERFISIYEGAIESAARR